MQTCVVCGNSSRQTSFTRPQLVYHKFPRNQIIRNLWLQVLRIRQCSNSHYVCGDHFLKENYNPGKKRRILIRNTIPQPYDQNIFPNNSNIQTNAVETGKNVDMKSEHLPNPKIEESQNPTVIETDVRPVLTATKDFCSIEGCISNITNTDEEPYLFTPRIECVNEWSSALGVQLTANSYICERHFRPQDLICEEFSVDGLKDVVKLLVYPSLPIAINDVPSASNTKNNLPDNTNKCSKSNTFMDVEGIPNIESDVKQKLKKILTENSLSVTLEGTSTLKVQDNKLKDNTEKCSESNTFKGIDNFPTIDSKLKQKLKNMSAKNSFSITLDPIEKSKVIEPSVDLSSKTSASIKTTVISKCVSLARIQDTHNSNSNKNNPTSKTSSLINNMTVVKRH